MVVFVAIGVMGQKKDTHFEYLKKFLFGGAWGIQTPDLINANDAFYQLN